MIRDLTDCLLIPSEEEIRIAGCSAPVTWEPVVPASADGPGDGGYWVIAGHWTLDDTTELQAELDMLDCREEFCGIFGLIEGEHLPEVAEYFLLCTFQDAIARALGVSELELCTK